VAWSQRAHSTVTWIDLDLQGLSPTAPLWTPAAPSTADLTAAQLVTLYIRSFYYTLSIAATNEYVHIYSPTLIETALSVGMACIAGFAYLGVLGFVSSFLADLSANSRMFFEQFDNLLAFMKLNRVSSALGTRLKNYYHYVWSREQGTSDRAVLEHLPQALRNEVLVSVAYETLHELRLFADCSSDFIRSVCAHVRWEPYAAGTVIVHADDVQNRAYIMLRGRAVVMSSLQRDSASPAAAAPSPATARCLLAPCPATPQQSQLVNILSHIDDAQLRPGVCRPTRHHVADRNGDAMLDILHQEADAVDDPVLDVCIDAVELKARISSAGSSTSAEYQVGVMTDGDAVGELSIVGEDEPADPQAVGSSAPVQRSFGEAIRCETYCDVAVLSRARLHAAAKGFPLDLAKVRLNAVNERGLRDGLTLAQSLNLCKPKVQTLCGVGAVVSSSAAPFGRSSVDQTHSIHPQSSFRARWEIAGSAITAYYALIIPWRLCFGSWLDQRMIGLEYALDVFWWFDVYLSITRFAFVDYDGTLITSPSELWRQYRARRLTWDVISLAPLDLLRVISPSSVQLAIWLRLPRLLRVAWLPSYFENVVRIVQESSQELGFAVQANVVKLFQQVFAGMLLAHWLACCLGAIARFQGLDSSWVAGAGLAEQHEAAIYTAALVFATSVLTYVGFGSVVPKTVIETLFTSLCLVFGLIFIAFLLEKILDLFTNLDQAAARLRLQLDKFDAYAKRRQLPTSLRARVHAYWKHRFGSREGLNETQVLADLPMSLRTEVTSELYADLLRTQAYFSFLEPNLISHLASHLKLQVRCYHDIEGELTIMWRAHGVCT